MPDLLQPAEDQELELLVTSDEGDLAYTGWERVAVTRSIDAAAGSWEVEGAQARPWALRPGAKVEARLADELVSVGYVDEFEASATGNELRIRASGRDATADLVDCSAVNEPGQWFDVDLHALARALAAPMGVPVRREVSLFSLEPVFETWVVQPGETAWTAIERAARMRGTTIYSGGDGALVITRPGTLRTGLPLVMGAEGNVLTATMKSSHRERYSRYLVRGQRAGSDTGWGESVAAVEGSALDGAVARERPLLIIAEGSVAAEDANLRARWEASFRAARSQELEVVLQGWRQGEGLPIWPVNALVDVDLPPLGLEARLLIRSARYTRGPEGTRTVLRLVREDAYVPQPELPAESDPWAGILEDEVGLE